MHDAPAGVRDAHVGVVFAAGADAVRSTMRRSQVRSPGFFVHRLSVHLFHRSISIAAFHRNRAFTTVEKRIVRVVDARGGATYSVPRMRWVGSHQGLSCRVVVPPPLHSTARAEEPERGGGSVLPRLPQARPAGSRRWRAKVAGGVGLGYQSATVLGGTISALEFAGHALEFAGLPRIIFKM